MPRIYVAGFENVAVALAQDLVNLATTSLTGVARIRRLWLMCTAGILPTAQQLRLLAVLFEGGTIGSGGSAATAYQMDLADAAAVAAPRVNDTTLTVIGAGTRRMSYPMGMYIYQGIDVVFSDPLVVRQGDQFAFQLLTAPLASVTMSGGIEWEEIG